MSEKRFKSYALFKGKKTVYRDNEAYTNEEVADLLNHLHQENNILNKNEDDLKECTIENIKLKEENEQLKQELRGMNELLKSYRETIKHDAELLADATRNGYLPPLEDFVKRGLMMRDQELKISFSDEDTCILKLETEFPKTVLRDLYFKMMNMNDAQRIEFLKRCLDECETI